MERRTRWTVVAWWVGCSFVMAVAYGMTLARSPMEGSPGMSDVPGLVFHGLVMALPSGVCGVAWTYLAGRCRRWCRGALALGMGLTPAALCTSLDVAERMSGAGSLGLGLAVAVLFSGLFLPPAFLTAVLVVIFPRSFFPVSDAGPAADDDAVGE